jgi:hypothetical protein
MIVNKKHIILATLILISSLNVHAAKNEWTFIVNFSDLHLIGSDHHLKSFRWFQSVGKFSNMCNASYFTSRDAVGPYITDLKIKTSNVYNWWWIGWNCDTAIVSNKTVNKLDKTRLNYLVAGTPILIRNNKQVSKKEMLESCTNKFFYRKCPRTAIGILKNKIVIYITSSASILELQARMQSIGCSYALNLDGGGSTFIKTNQIQYPKKITRKYPNCLAW